MNFQCNVIKIENVLRLWRMTKLSIEEKVLVFKCLAISKIVHVSPTTRLPYVTINQLNIAHGRNPKIKQH